MLSLIDGNSPYDIVKSSNKIIVAELYNLFFFDLHQLSISLF
jgi:hypothetical protein